jgi:Mg2+-importing ATPase
MASDSGSERKFWQITLVELEKQLAAGRDGLTSAEVASRRVRYGPNSLEERRRLSLPLEYLGRFRNPLVLILLVAAGISALTGDLTSFIIICARCSIPYRSTEPRRPPSRSRPARTGSSAAFHS